MVAAFSKERGSGEPQGEPAIVLRGEAIRLMTPEHRKRIALSLGTLLGAHAEVMYAPVDRQPSAKQEDEESAEAIPPFSLIIRHRDNWAYPAPGVEKAVRLITRQHPGSLRDESMTKRALAAVGAAGSRASASDTDLHQHFDFHYDKAPAPDLKDRVAAITFKNPDALIHGKDDVRDTVHNLGPKGVEALAELALVVTGTAPAQAQGTHDLTDS